MMFLNRGELVRKLLPVALAMVLVGCESDDFSDLKEYVSQIKAKPAGAIEPMPVIKSYESFSYVADSLRNPFQALEEPKPFETLAAIEGPGPDLNREKEELEAYPLDTLRMVGTLSRGGDLWGLVRASDGIVHRVQSGHFLGQNFGKIEAVSDHKIDLSEWVNTSTGRWRERDASLALIE